MRASGADRRLGQQRPEQGRDAVAAHHADHPDPRVRCAGRRGRARAPGDLGRDRDRRPGRLPSHVFPIDDNASIVITLIGMAVGVDYSLFYLKREREERLNGRDELSCGRDRLGHVGSCDPHLGIHRHGRDGGPVPHRRQGVHRVRRRHHHGGRGRDARFAHGAAGDPGPAGPPRRQGPHPDPVSAAERPHAPSRGCRRACSTGCCAAP